MKKLWIVLLLCLVVAPAVFGAQAYFKGGAAFFDSGTASAASGADAFAASVNGAHWHIGTGSIDYFYGDGTNIFAAGLVAFDNLVQIRNNVAGVTFQVGSAGDQKFFINGQAQTAGFNNLGTISFTSAPIVTDATQNKGSATLSVGGTATVTVLAGAKCVVSEETSTAGIHPKGSVSGTTLTITGVPTDTISYICL